MVNENAWKITCWTFVVLGSDLPWYSVIALQARLLWHRSYWTAATWSPKMYADTGLHLKRDCPGNPAARAFLLLVWISSVLLAKLPRSYQNCYPIVKCYAWDAAFDKCEVSIVTWCDFRGSLVFHSLVFHIHCWSLTFARWTCMTDMEWLIWHANVPCHFSILHTNVSSHSLPINAFSSFLWLPLIPEKKPTGWVANRLTSWRQSLNTED